MKIGDNIQSARKNAGLTQRELAQKVGKGFSTIQKYEIGIIIPPLETVQKIADVLGVGLFQLLDESRKNDVLEMVDYINPKDEKEKQRVVEYFVKQKISDLPFDTFSEATDESDRAFIDKMKPLTDAYLFKQYKEIFQYLNRRGKIEAVMRMEELNEVKRFHKNYDNEK